MFDSFNGKFYALRLEVTRLYMLIPCLDKNKLNIVMSISSWYWSFAYYLISFVNFEIAPRNTFFVYLFWKEDTKRKMFGGILDMTIIWRVKIGCWPFKQISINQHHVVCCFLRKITTVGVNKPTRARQIFAEMLMKFERDIEFYVYI